MKSHTLGLLTVRLLAEPMGLMLVGALLVTSVATAESVGKTGGFTTAQPSMLTPVMPNVEVEPIPAVGDVLFSGYRFEALPDGLALRTVDASAAFGPGSYLIAVQSHTLWVEKAPGDDNNGDGQPDFTYKREGGQLLLIRIPGM